ncbi:MAG: hypothetical protein ABW128_17190 [Rhizorhabdus sp.]
MTAPKVASDTEQRNSHDDAEVYGIGIEVDGVAIHPGRVVIRKRKVASDTCPFCTGASEYQGSPEDAFCERHLRLYRKASAA